MGKNSKTSKEVLLVCVFLLIALIVYVVIKAKTGNDTLAFIVAGISLIAVPFISGVIRAEITSMRFGSRKKKEEPNKWVEEHPIFKPEPIEDIGVSKKQNSENKKQDDIDDMNLF